MRGSLVLANFRGLSVVAVIAATWLWLVVNSQLQALWPSVVALLVVFITRKAIVGLLSGAVAGALLLANGNPWEAYLALFRDHLAPSLNSSWKMGAVFFTLVLGGFAAVLEKGGGFEALILRFIHGKKAPARRFQLGTVGLGFACFFDGLANSMMVGRLSQSFAGRSGVSKVKVAYIVDTTSSAVACLAFVSTWIAFQLSLIRDGFAQVGVEVNPYLYFVRSLEFNFYCWFALLFLVVGILRDFNIGPMRRFEMEARGRIESVSEKPIQSIGIPFYTVWVPLAVLLCSLILGFYFIGLPGDYLPITKEKISTAFGTNEGPLVMAFASVCAVVAAFVCYPYGRDRESPVVAFKSGMQSLLYPLLILVSAWMLGSTLSSLGTGVLVSELVSGSIPAFWLPCLIFVVGAMISFSTGTSWGTMGILMPIAIPLIAGFGGDMSPEYREMLYASSVGAVFSGAVFGDHCSPISDTTIVSAIASGVEPHDHVRTQMPYALIAAAAAICLGFLPSALGLSGWVGILNGVVGFWILSGKFGRMRTEV